MPLKSLNQNQLEAATASFGHNLIIASAGTGKTSTIIGRISYLLDNGAKPEEILLLTFTNKAATEMLERGAAFFGKEKASKIKAGTFHAVSYKWLKELDKKIVLKRPAEIKTLFRSVYEKRDLARLDIGSAFSAAFLYDLYSLFQNDAKDSFSLWIKQKYPEHEEFVDIYEDIVDEFEELKEKLGFVSFNDLLILMKKEIQTNIKNPFKEVLIDEYQDTNPLQDSLIQALNPPSLFCVGDYDQSIYAFNGARIEIIAGFKDRFEDANVFSLEVNYRSTASILSLANKVIQNNPRIYPKKLKVSRSDANIAPKLLIYDELFLQYEGIAKLISKSNTPHQEIAVIFRNNSSADGIEAMLREYNIPAKRRGSSSLFESMEIKALLDLFTLVVNQKDMLSFIHIFEYAPGIGAAIAMQIYEGLNKIGNDNLFQGMLFPDMNIKPYERGAKNIQMGLFEEYEPEFVLQNRFKDLDYESNFLKNPILQHQKLTHDSVEFIHKFFLFVKNLQKTKKPLQLIEYIQHSQIYQYICDKLSTKRAMKKDKTIDEKEKSNALFRINAKVELIKRLAIHYHENERFLNAMVLGSSEMSEGEGVNLLSVHASKGLEFEEVFVCDLMQGRFPNTKLMKQGGSLEEERRLFYVAVTRAKTILYLSFAKYNKLKKTDYLPSIFLSEAEILK